MITRFIGPTPGATSFTVGGLRTPGPSRPEIRSCAVSYSSDGAAARTCMKVGEEMKPRIFIGSSREAKAVADGIHAELERDAECTVWTQGVFGLGATAVDSLMARVRGSDFAIFVFAEDDQATMRGRLFSVPRDNVIYELGLFSGALGPERCLFLTPLGSDIHLPTDLLGMTAGSYDDKRSDKNMQAAVGPFCVQVRIKITDLGFAHGLAHEQLRDLAVKFECCEWIVADPKRVSQKQLILADMGTFCQNHAVNKGTLLGHGPGFDVALAAAIIANPESGDDKLLLRVPSITIARGVAQHVMVTAIFALADNGKLNSSQRSAIVRWVENFRDRDPSLEPRIVSLKAENA